MQLLHPADRTPLNDADGKPVTITLLGRDSDVFLKAERIIRNKRMDLLKKGGKFSAAEEDEEACETLARCTKAWSGIPTGWIDGKADPAPAECTFSNAAKLYGRMRWVREQVDEFIGSRENFLKASSGS
jgi:hypothetical protein